GNFLGDFPLRRGWCLLCESRGVCLACFYVTKHCAHRVGLLQLHGDSVDLALAGRSHTHDRFVRLYVDDFLFFSNLVAQLYLNISDSRFRDRFAQLRHDDRNLRHSFILAAVRELWLRCFLRSADARSTGLDDMELECLLRSGAAALHPADEIPGS